MEWSGMDVGLILSYSHTQTHTLTSAIMVEVAMRKASSSNMASALASFNRVYTWQQRETLGSNASLPFFVLCVATRIKSRFTFFC